MIMYESLRFEIFELQLTALILSNAIHSVGAHRALSQIHSIHPFHRCTVTPQSRCIPVPASSSKPAIEGTDPASIRDARTAHGHPRVTLAGSVASDTLWRNGFRKCDSFCIPGKLKCGNNGMNNMNFMQSAIKF
jgi:hypothetical protein